MSFASETDIRTVSVVYWALLKLLLLNGM